MEGQQTAAAIAGATPSATETPLLPTSELLPPVLDHAGGTAINDPGALPSAETLPALKPESDAVAINPKKRQIELTEADTPAYPKRTRRNVSFFIAGPANSGAEVTNTSLRCSAEDRKFNMCSESLELLRSWWHCPGDETYFERECGPGLLSVAHSRLHRFHIAASFALSELYALSDGEMLRSPVNYFTMDGGRNFTGRLTVARRILSAGLVSAAEFVFTVETSGCSNVSRLALELTKITEPGNNRICSTDPTHTQLDRIDFAEKYIRSFVYRNDMDLKVLLSFSVRK